MIDYGAESANCHYYRAVSLFFVTVKFRSH